MFAALLMLLAAAPVRTLRVSPVDHEGKPTECIEKHCGLELMRDGRVFSARHKHSLIFGPGLSLRSKRDGPVVFEKEKSGKLVGDGPYRAAEAVQVLFCELRDGPVLRCRHQFDAAQRERVWNEKNCEAGFEARVVGGNIEVTFPAFPDAKPQVAAKVELTGGDSETALFLYALRVIEADTEFHTPFIDGW